MRTLGCGGAAALVLLCSGCFDEPGEASCLTIGCDAEVSSSGDPSGGSTLGPTGDPSTGVAPTSDADDSSGPSSSVTDSTTGPTASSSGVDTVADSSSTAGESSTTDAPGPVCGNGRVEDSEECDDADADPYDGCEQCLSVPELVWAYEYDYDDGDDRAVALARDGAGVLVGGFYGTDTNGDDGAWLRLVNGVVAPAPWSRVANLAGDNRIYDLARGPDACVIAGHVTPAGMMARAAANLVDCGSGVAQGGLPLPEADPDIAQDIRGIAISSTGVILVGANLVEAGVQRGWFGVFSPDGATLQTSTWFSEPTLFGDASRLNGLWRAPNDDVFVAGAWIEDGDAHGFVARVDGGEPDPIPFGDDAESSQALAVFATPSAIYAAGWTEDILGVVAAVVEAYPMMDDDLSWTLGASSDDRVFGIDGSDAGVVVTGHTGDSLPGRDLFIAWLDTELVEVDRVVYDGGGPDGGTDILIDDDGVIVGGYTENAISTDLLVQRWTRPD